MRYHKEQTRKCLAQAGVVMFAVGFVEGVVRGVDSGLWEFGLLGIGIFGIMLMVVSCIER